MNRNRTPGPSSCFSCRSPIDEGQTLCPCGKPTGYMSFAERNRYEVERWRQMKSAGA